MASVKFYLDKRSRKMDGTYPLKLTITHKKPFQISLDVSVKEENWIGDKIEGDVKNKVFLNSYLASRYTAVENYLLTLKLWGKLDRITPAQLKKMIENLTPGDINPDIPVDGPDTLLGENYLFRDHAKKFIETRKTGGTKEIYNFTMDTLARFYDLNTLTFGDVNYDWLEYFEIKLSPTCKINTISIHLRNIRAIFKNANKKKLVSKDLYPFDDYQIRNEETMHRDLSVEDLRKLRDYPVEPHQERYRDLFMLQFYLMGISLTDILHAEEIRNDRIQYRRAKTGRLYDVKVHPEAMVIIKKYSPGKKHLLNFLDNYELYRDFRNRYNRNLKEIGPLGKNQFGEQKRAEYQGKEIRPAFSIPELLLYPPYLGDYCGQHRHT